MVVVEEGLDSLESRPNTGRRFFQLRLRPTPPRRRSEVVHRPCFWVNLVEPPCSGGGDLCKVAALTQVPQHVVKLSLMPSKLTKLSVGWSGTTLKGYEVGLQDVSSESVFGWLHANMIVMSGQASRGKRLVRRAYNVDMLPIDDEVADWPRANEDEGCERVVFEIALYLPIHL